MIPLDSMRLSARVVLPWSTCAMIVTRRVESGDGSMVRILYFRGPARQGRNLGGVSSLG